MPERHCRGVAALAVVLLGFAPVLCAAEGPTWRIERGDVRIVVPLKPGGAFEAKTSSLAGSLVVGESTPLALAGTIAVELASIETGISLRDQHLRENYLEVDRGRGFDEAVLSEIVLSDVASTDFRGRTGFEGTLMLHGVSRPLTGKGEIRAAGTGVHVEAAFHLTLTDFDIEPPQYMGVGVTNRVAVKVSFVARPVRGGE